MTGTFDVHEHDRILTLPRERAAGRWFIETDKGVRLFCEAVDDYGPRFSYRPGDPIAVCPSWGIFAVNFKAAQS